MRVPAGTRLWIIGDDALRGFHVVHGVVACHGEKRSFRMGPRSVIGVLDANGGLPRSYSAVAETDIVGLRTDSDQFLDLLEDNYSLAMNFMKFSARRVLNMSVRLAEAEIARTGSFEAAESFGRLFGEAASLDRVFLGRSPFDFRPPPLW